MTLQPAQALTMLNSEFVHKQASRLAESIGAKDLDNGEVVRRAINSVLARKATDTEVQEGRQLIEKLTKENIPRERAVQLYCLTVLNWNEFLFVD